nr:hypothetical protein [uncultured Acetatifactor sp.]
MDTWQVPYQFRPLVRMTVSTEDTIRKSRRNGYEFPDYDSRSNYGI